MRQLRRFGFCETLRLVFSMTHVGTRVFWRVSFASRFFFAFDFLLIRREAVRPRLKHSCFGGCAPTE